jgi:hypothetical protein
VFSGRVDVQKGGDEVPLSPISHQSFIPMKQYTEEELESLIERVDALGGYL